MTVWTHWATWPDHRPAHDRVVLREGVKVGRTYRNDHGPQAGAWAWFGQWEGPREAGTAASVGDALNAIRERAASLSPTD